jgi:hypothetical protein
LEGRISIIPIGQGEEAQGRVMGSFGEKRFLVSCVFSWEEEDNECVRGEF